MKKLVLRKFSSDAIPTEHPDLGGTFNIRPMTFDEALRYAELVTKQDFARDSAGRIVYNRDGSPAMKYAGDPREHIEFAASLLDESMRQLLTLMGTDEIEMEVPADADGKPLDQAKLTPEEIEEHKAGTTTVKKPVRENVYLWVTRKSAFYAGERNKVVKGN
jgi:hypothetical protein